MASCRGDYGQTGPKLNWRGSFPLILAISCQSSLHAPGSGAPKLLRRLGVGPPLLVFRCDDALVRAASRPVVGMHAPVGVASTPEVSGHELANLDDAASLRLEPVVKARSPNALKSKEAGSF